MNGGDSDPTEESHQRTNTDKSGARATETSKDWEVKLRHCSTKNETVLGGHN